MILIDHLDMAMSNLTPRKKLLNVYKISMDLSTMEGEYQWKNLFQETKEMTMSQIREIYS